MRNEVRLFTSSVGLEPFRMHLVSLEPASEPPCFADLGDEDIDGFRVVVLSDDQFVLGAGAGADLDMAGQVRLGVEGVDGEFPVLIREEPCGERGFSSGSALVDGVAVSGEAVAVGESSGDGFGVAGHGDAVSVCLLFRGEPYDFHELGR